MTITTDNGPEFAHTRKLSRNYNVRFTMQNPMHHGRKEQWRNANMLIRQYVPKGFNINTMSISIWHIYRTKLIVDQEKN